MTGYDIFIYCRMIQTKSKIPLDTYLKSKSKAFYESLSKYFIETLQLNRDDIKGYIKAALREYGENFTPFVLRNEECLEIYNNWKEKSSTKASYYKSVVRSFSFIENFCLKRKIDITAYKNNYAKTHIYEKKIDYAVVVYLGLVDRRKLKSIDKLLLKEYLGQIKNIEYRLTDDTLKKILANRKERLYNILASTDINTYTSK